MLPIKSQFEQLMFKKRYSEIDLNRFAKQQSIEFCKWVQSFENLSRCREFHNCETNEQIYDLFIQSNPK